MFVTWLRDQTQEIDKEAFLSAPESALTYAIRNKASQSKSLILFFINNFQTRNQLDFNFQIE